MTPGASGHIGQTVPQVVRRTRIRADTQPPHERYAHPIVSSEPAEATIDWSRVAVIMTVSCIRRRTTRRIALGFFSLSPSATIYAACKKDTPGATRFG